MSFCGGGGNGRARSGTVTRTARPRMPGTGRRVSSRYQRPACEPVPNSG
ncbi:hypothetical protein C882_4292 [Caenispirillum salinarum AK4]|uniref:Uncharacterized protein n=1 Tax=Caenispirillum salinarum AK4 TaxID=1238182 RepID=K9HIX5_9PROT|nr:hypothetical protein C882_4292 [Caenispirillum salinarum AK4]